MRQDLSVGRFTEVFGCGDEAIGRVDCQRYIHRLIKETFVSSIDLVIDQEKQTVESGTTGTTWYEQRREVVALMIDGRGNHY